MKSATTGMIWKVLIEMPELPEVETVLRSLKPKVLSRKINRVTVINEKTIKKPDAAAFTRCLEGQQIKDINRHGSTCCSSFPLMLVVHLRSRRLLFKIRPPDRYTCVITSWMKERFTFRMSANSEQCTISCDELDLFHLLALGPDALILN